MPIDTFPVVETTGYISNIAEKNIACGFNRMTTSIGCNYCVEMDPVHFQMSKKDGKSVLIHSQNAKGFYTLKSPNQISV